MSSNSDKEMADFWESFATGQVGQPSPVAYKESPWSLSYDSTMGVPSVSIKYKNELLGRVQKCELCFDAKQVLPLLKLEIYVPGITINPPAVKE